MKTIRKFLSQSVVERALWTLAQAGAGFASVELVHVPVAYAPLVAAALSVIKTTIKERLNGLADTEVQVPAAVSEVVGVASGTGSPSV